MCVISNKICLNLDQVSLNAGQKHCRMLQEEHSAILSTFIKLPFVIKIFVLSIFEWPFYTGLTVKSSWSHVDKFNIAFDIHCFVCLSYCLTIKSSG